MGYLKCLYMQPRVGETFEATISSALEFGLFVQLKEMPIDGLVHISAIPGDYWELENGGMGLVGQRTGRRWQMGDTVQRALEPRRSHAAADRFRAARCGAAPSSHGTVRAPRRGPRRHRAARRGSAAQRAGAAGPRRRRGASRGGRG